VAEVEMQRRGLMHRCPHSMHTPGLTQGKAVW
jgi:hypothetical protein